MTQNVCRATSITLAGLDGTPVVVEAAVSQQLPGMHIIGLPDTALAEAKQRVRTATAQAGLPLADRCIIVNLSPAEVPKHGSGFDLSIALASLAASGRLPADRLAETIYLGELGLDGELRRPAGLLTAALAARRLGFARVMVPEHGSAEAALVPDLEVVAARDLAGAVAWHRGDPDGWRIVTPHETRLAANTATNTAASAAPRDGRGGTTGDTALHRPPTSTPDAEHFALPDMSELIGQADAVEACVIAAAGRHHLFLGGPPGIGKTLLASRIPTILPDLTPEESRTASSIASLGTSALTQLVRRPPFESPHHTASLVSIIGGGAGSTARPGAITRACHGVLFLDEAPEFPRTVLDSLRQPLESGTVEIHRSRVRTQYPARFQLVLAANPCPCGHLESGGRALCRCSPSARVRYQHRLSGPLLDRIDLRLELRRVPGAMLHDESQSAPASAVLRERVGRARAQAAERLHATPWRVNAEVPGSWLRSREMRLPRTATAVIDQALSRGALTARGYDRILRVSWSVADLAGRTSPGRNEIAQALALRGEDTP